MPAATKVEITMPRLSDSMESGTILTWLIASGETVAAGADLVEIETDKATIVHLADVAGVLEILVSEGTTVAVGTPIARIGGAPAERSSGTPDPPRAHAHIRAREPTDASAVTAARADAPASAGDGAHASTPLARRAARMHGVELARVDGSGPRGRITRGDVLRFAGVESEPPPARVRASGRASDAATGPANAAAKGRDGEGAQGTSGAAAVVSAKGERQRVEASRTQELIARRMAESKATIPHFQVQTEVTMDASLALRDGLKASASGADVPSLNDFVVKACAVVLREHPRANASFLDGGFELHRRINVGVAVATQDALVVPVVADADTLSLGGIARQTRRLAESVRAGTITPAELSGGTFTVSNLGMYGASAITPVINPPQTAILGVGALRATLARSGGAIVDRTLMTLTLSCDHRVLYGADAARLLADVRTLLEQPVGLAL